MDACSRVISTVVDVPWPTKSQPGGNARNARTSASLHGLRDRFGVAIVVLMPFEERLHVLCRDQPYIMTQSFKPACVRLSHQPKRSGLTRLLVLLTATMISA